MRRIKKIAKSHKRSLDLYRIILIIFCFTIISFGLPDPVAAANASLYFTPSTGTFPIKGTFTVAVKINTDNETANATEGTISFDAKILEVDSFSKSGSTLALWTTEPTYNNKTGVISFGGGMPRPGYKGEAGQILNITFKAKIAGATMIRFSSGAILANDGQGSNILSTLGSAGFTISPVEALPPSESTGSVPEIKPTGPEYNKPAIVSASHPDENAWYNNNKAVFSWQLPAGTEEASFELTKAPTTEPDNKAEAQATSKEYPKLADGIWYFHLKFKDAEKWGTAAHYRVMIDTTAPDPFDVKVRQVEVGNWPEFELESSDIESGIKKYEIIIGSLESQAYEVSGDEKIFQPTGLTPGEHTALIRVVDQAGNDKVKMITFMVDPIDTPTIKNYPQEIRPDDQLFITGNAIPNTSVQIYMQKGGEEDIKNAIFGGKVQSDASGNWFYVNKDNLANDRYVAWAVAQNDRGVSSNPSNKVTFLVSPPVFTKIGSLVINYFTVFVSLLFMIILIVASVMYIANFLRRRLKKETVEAEYVVHRNFTDLGEIIDEEFNELNKMAGTAAYNKERIKFKQRIKNYMTEAERKIMKEIKDVEKIVD